MQKLSDFLENRLMAPMSKLSQFHFVRAVGAAGMGSIPFTIVGSAFLIISIVPTVLPFMSSIWSVSFDKITNLYMIGNTFTMGILALYFTIIMGYELTKIKAEYHNLDLSPLNGSMLGLMAFLFTMVQLIVKDGGIAYIKGDNMINGVAYGSFANRLGSSGIFTGIIMAYLAVSIYTYCVKKGWTIKLPNVVPSGVSRSFTALIPTFVVAFLVLIINGLLVLTGYDIYSIIEIPFGFVKNILNSWYGIIIVELLVHILWSVGIHGASIIGSFYTPFALANLEINQNLLLKGATHGYQVFAGEFQTMFSFIGGSGGTLGLCLFMLLIAKSEQLKVLGKSAIVPSIFGINEPIIFGLPIMYNPNLLIPFILAPTVTAAIAYFAISSGIFPPIIANVPWCTPAILNATIGTGSIMGGILAIICFVINFAIYFPFLKAYDKKLLSEEQAIN